MSRVTAIISAWLSASSSACRGLLIITVITPLPTKPSATKCQRISWRNAARFICRCAKAHVAALDAKYTKEYDAKAEMRCFLRRDAGRRRLHIKAVCQSVREATTASGVDNSLPRLADTAERDYFTLRERPITMQNNWKEPRSINELVQIELPISMGNSCNYCEY